VKSNVDKHKATLLSMTGHSGLLGQWTGL